MGRHSQKSIVITGASAGLGRALALRYAGQGRALALMGRNTERLQDVADASRARGAVVEAHACDLCEIGSGQDFIRAFAAAHPIDLLIVNAGVFSGHHPARDMEDGGEIAAVLRTNLEAAILTIAAALPAMRARGRGRIAIIGSLAALHPLADAPAYSASKAGLMAYGEALREWLQPDGVAVSLVYPGHIETAHVAGHVGALPLILSADAAAARIKRGLDRGRDVIAFPRRLLLLIRAGRLVPWRLRAPSAAASASRRGDQNDSRRVTEWNLQALHLAST
jgi:short-subunit dehydrogenase